MPTSVLNNAATGNAYSDALTVVFSYPRKGFSMQVFNAAVMYQLAYSDPSGRSPVWEPLEHMAAPSLNTFQSAESEGLPPGSAFMGIRVRSAVAGTPANVTVA